MIYISIANVRHKCDKPKIPRVPLGIERMEAAWICEVCGQGWITEVFAEESSYWIRKGRGDGPWMLNKATEIEDKMNTRSTDG